MSARKASASSASLAERDKLNLVDFWLTDASATDPDNPPPPDELAAEIVDSLEFGAGETPVVAAALAAGTSPSAGPNPALVDLPSGETA